MKKNKYSGVPKPVMVLACFSPEEFEQLKLVADDPDELHDSYEEWLASKNSVREGLSAEGWLIREYQVDVADLRRWCDVLGVPLDGKARSNYAVEKAATGER